MSAFGGLLRPDGLQQDTERYHLLQEVLTVYDEGFAELFDDAWRSETLDDCPPLKEWYDLVDELPRGPVASWAPVDSEEFAIDRRAGQYRRARRAARGSEESSQGARPAPGAQAAGGHSSSPG